MENGTDETWRTYHSAHLERQTAALEKSAKAAGVMMGLLIALTVVVGVFVLAAMVGSV